MSHPRLRAMRAMLVVALLALLALPAAALAHEIGGSDATFVARTSGPAPWAFAYLGAKHMVTGYDHILFLLGVVFFLSRLRDVVAYVSLFALGHSITLLAGTLMGFGANAHLVDAAIGFSVIYKAFDNLGGFRSLAGRQPDPRLAVLGFGLIHGLGLATRLEALHLDRDGLLANLLAFNGGVEVGQILALTVIVGLLALWRGRPGFAACAVAANWLLIVAGTVLVAFQLAGYAWS